MARSRVFGFLAIAMCLVAFVCVCAEATKEEAEAAVAELQRLASQALRDAKANSKSATRLLNDVQMHKRSATETTSQAENAAKGNEEAKAVASEVKKEADEAIALYADANTAADSAAKSMKMVLTKAEELNTKADIAVSPDVEGGSDYTGVTEKAAKVKTDVEKLQTDIKNSARLLVPASTAELKMSESVEKAKVLRYQVYIIVSGAKIDAELGKADTAIRSAEQKRDEVNKTLNEMKKHSENAPKNLLVYVDSVLRNTEDRLSTASKAVDDAKKVKEDMLKLKNSADASLAKVKKETDSKKAADEWGSVKLYAEDVAKKAPQLASALQSAEIAAANAASTKQAFMATLSKDNSQPGKEDGKVPKNTGQPAKDKAKDKAKGAVDKGATSAFGANNDGAKTVSFSLMLALMVCAALH